MKMAFTLAEVLITLGIIGVVAAMTIPNLLTKIDHAHKISYLKKAQSIMNQAIKLSTIDNEDYESWDTTLSHQEFIEKYLAPYMKISVYCDTAQKCGYSSSNPWTRYSGNTGYTGFNYMGRVPFLTLEGILYSFSLSGGTNTGDSSIDVQYDYSVIGTNAIFVDVNGHNLPNRFGNDIFVLVRTSEGTVVPLGYNLSNDEINNDCNKKALCMYCAEKLRRNGWKSTSDYPW